MTFKLEAAKRILDTKKKAPAKKPSIPKKPKGKSLKRGQDKWLDLERNRSN